MYCKKCGKRLADGDKFCSLCGARVEGPDLNKGLRSDGDGGEEKSKPAFHMTGLNWDLDGFPRKSKPSDNIDFNWSSVMEERDRRRLEEKNGETRIMDEQELFLRIKGDDSAQSAKFRDFNWNLGSTTRIDRAENIEPYLWKEDDAFIPAPLREAQGEAARTARAGFDGEGQDSDGTESAAPEAVQEQPKHRYDAEEAAAAMAEGIAAAQAAPRKNIDKFYTFNKKNEEFQQLLDEEYERLRKRIKEESEAEEMIAAKQEKLDRARESWGEEEIKAPEHPPVRENEEPEFSDEEDPANDAETQASVSAEKDEKEADVSGLEEKDNTSESAEEASGKASETSEAETERASEPAERATGGAPENVSEHAGEASKIAAETAEAAPESTAETAEEDAPQADSEDTPDAQAAESDKGVGSAEPAEEAEPDEAGEQGVDASAEEASEDVSEKACPPSGDEPEEQGGGSADGKADGGKAAEKKEEEDDAVEEKAAGGNDRPHYSDIFADDDDDDDNSAQKKSGRAKLIVLDIIIVILVIATAATAVMAFFPESAAAAKLRRGFEQITSVMHFDQDQKNEETLENSAAPSVPEASDAEATATEQALKSLALTSADNITSISADSALKFKDTYGVSASGFTDGEWPGDASAKKTSEKIVSTVAEYYSAYCERMNSGGDKVLSIIDRSSELYKQVEAITAGNDTHSISSLSFGDIVSEGNTYYSLVRVTDNAGGKETSSIYVVTLNDSMAVTAMTDVTSR